MSNSDLPRDDGGPAPRDDGGPAFPWGEYGTHLGGMSLRDYFAAKALAECFNFYWANVQSGETACDEGWRIGVAVDAYAMADAMLKARSA